MDNMQSWPNPAMNPRQNMPPNLWTKPQRPITQPPAPQPQQMARPQSLSDRLEAMRAQMEERLNRDGLIGFQVVRREFMSHSFEPAMTVKENCITFNNACISKLENATYIQFLINTEEQKLIIRPCSEGARDAVRWCISKDDKRRSRQITCRDFTDRLYELMGWERVYRYKLQGVGIDYHGEKLYLFDLQCQEAFAPSFRDPETGKMVRSKAILPEGMMDSFGMSVEEHDKSVQVDLNAGYVQAGAEEAGSIEKMEGNGNA